MKKNSVVKMIAVVAAAAALTFSVAGCGSKKAETEAPAATAETTAATDAAADTAVTEAATEA